MKSSHKDEINRERKRFIYALFIPLVFTVVVLLVHLLQLEFPVVTHSLGLYPRRLDGFQGVIGSVLVHGGWKHLFENLVTFWVLSLMFFYIYRDVALQLFLQMWVYSGLLLWVIGRPSYHVGASGLIFAMAFFLFVSGVLRKQTGVLAAALVVVFLYGGMVWQMFPWEATYTISWEGHLAGAIVGSVLALLYRHVGPQPEPEIDDSDLDDVEPYWEVTDENSEDKVVKH